MEATFAAQTFSNLEEIGPRLRLLRVSLGLNVSNVAERAGLNYITVATVEKGSSSPATIEAVADALNAELIVRAVAQDGYHSSQVKLSELQGLIAATRRSRNLTLSEVGNLAGAQPSSVSVFENSGRPLVRSVKRYLEALGFDLEIEIQINGEAFIPTEGDNRSTKHAQNDLITTSATYGMFEKGFTSTIGSALLARREDMNLTKTELCERMGAAQQTISRIESGRGSLSSISAYAKSVGLNLALTLTDGSGRELETPTEKIAEVLDTVRQARGLSVAQMARLIGTTYRAVKNFPDGSQAQVQSIERYANALGMSVGHKLDAI
jgi:transcriptional regulator with XRE-family HTH domain